MRLHIDTDFAGDPDDACALAMVLGWSGAEITGITTTADPDGRRAGYVSCFLRLAGRDDIPVAAGAGASLTTQEPMGDIPDHDRYWNIPEMDWNVPCDTRAAQVVAATADLTLCTLPPTMKATLRRGQLPRLAASGPLGALLARQAVAYAEDEGLTELGRSHPGLPDDLLNFHWDPVACALALGWPGAATEVRVLRPVVEGGVLRFEPDDGGRAVRILTELDGEDFAESWIVAVEAAQARYAR